MTENELREIALKDYANLIIKHKKLQAKVLGFRNELDNLDTSVGGTIIISPKDSLDGFEVKSYYDNYFGIEGLTNGKIN